MIHALDRTQIFYSSFAKLILRATIFSGQRLTKRNAISKPSTREESLPLDVQGTLRHFCLQVVRWESADPAPAKNVTVNHLDP